MKKEGAKSSPIPTRFDDDVVELLDRLHAATGVSKSEIIRRAVRHSLDHAQRTGSLGFLFGDGSAVREALQGGPSEAKAAEAATPRAPSRKRSV